jgi:GTP-binding protein
VAFTDRARIHVEGGHGGGGCVSFRREARTPRGGPDGGNGGVGGSVYLVADATVEDLSRFRHAVHHKGRPGQPGSGRKRHGRNGDDAVIAVPVGTRVRRDDLVIATLDADGERAEVARGGEGGVGNWAFRSSTHQAPRESVPGAPGDETWLTLELRLPIDVAIVGLPNSGKSALLHALTGGAAVIAPYPRSTREPAFGPLRDDYENLSLVADLPGVDEEGAPRPDGRLGQLERVRIILHCVDVRDAETIASRLTAVRATVQAFANPDADEIVVGTFADDAEQVAEVDVLVDTPTGRGVDALRATLVARLGAGR